MGARGSIPPTIPTRVYGHVRHSPLNISEPSRHPDPMRLEPNISKTAGNAIWQQLLITIDNLL